MTYDIKCRHCGRFLAKTDKTIQIELKCSNSKCKILDTYKVVMMTDYLKGNHD